MSNQSFSVVAERRTDKKTSPSLLWHGTISYILVERNVNKSLLLGKSYLYVYIDRVRDSDFSPSHSHHAHRSPLWKQVNGVGVHSLAPSVGKVFLWLVYDPKGFKESVPLLSNRDREMTLITKGV